MRESSLNQFAKNSPVSRLETEANSLFRKILAISPYGSRFCQDRRISTNANSNEMRILRRYSKKNVGASASPQYNGDYRLGTATGQSQISLARSPAAS